MEKIRFYLLKITLIKKASEIELVNSIASSMLNYETLRTGKALRLLDRRLEKMKAELNLLVKNNFSLLTGINIPTVVESIAV